MPTPTTTLNIKPIIDACADCVRECGRCEAHCIRSKDDEVLDCIKLCQDAAECCLLLQRFLSRESTWAQDIGDACRRICEACATECERHSECEECKRAAQACRKVISAL